MTTIDLPSQAMLNKILRYDGEKLFWRERPVDMFEAAGEAKRWNTRYAGEEAFTTDGDNGYKQGRIFGRKYLAHRIIWKLVHGTDPEQVDHINGIRDDNRIENLRSVTSQENLKNQKMCSNNTSGVMGVYWYKRLGKWSARIMVAGKNKHLGYFTDKFDAIKARKNAEKEHGFHTNHGRIEDAS